MEKFKRQYINPNRLPWQLYVLELEDDCFYVGLATDARDRFEKHKRGKGRVRFTYEHLPLRIREIVECGTNDYDEACRQEDAKTLEYAREYGVDCVRGGKYMTVGQLLKALK